MSSISGYTTSYNCIERAYPLELCIKSLLGFCDEVCVVDAGSIDGTLELLHSLAASESRIKISVSPVDFSHPRWAIHMDGYLKAKARALCTAEYCWQTDNDEIVAPEDFSKVQPILNYLADGFAQYPVIYLPMVEFWGSFSRIRADFFSWKLRISKNDPRITHGIPNEHRVVDGWGFEYPRPFNSDSCNYIYRDTKESVPCAFPIEVPSFQMPADEYERFFNGALNVFPSVLHVSWLNLERKIEHYKKFWPKFHTSMYNLETEDTGDNNVMFSKPWSEVTPDDIKRKAQELIEIGPRSFHHKIDPTKLGETIPFQKSIPPELVRWARQTM